MAADNVIYNRFANLPPDGESPYDGRMEARVTALETRLDTILPTLATKVDLADLRTEMHKGFADMVKWIVGVAIAGVAIMLSVLTFYVNTSMRSAPQAQPVIIQLDGVSAASAHGGARLSVVPAAPASK